MRDLDRRIADVEKRIKAAVAQSKSNLVGLFGVGPVLAATFLGEVGDVHRFPSKHHFAAHTAPPHWRPPAARSSATGYDEPGTASSTPPCI